MPPGWGTNAPQVGVRCTHRPPAPRWLLDRVHARAAQAGVSVSDYLRELITEPVSRPTMAEIVERARALARASGGTSPADVRAVILGANAAVSEPASG